jgi:hypothetical protein
MYFRDYILFLYLLQKVHIGITNGLLDAAKKCPCENTDMYFCNIILYYLWIINIYDSRHTSIIIL